MSIRSEIEDGIEELHGELDDHNGDPKVFQWWNGVEIECIASSLERGTAVISGGKEWEVAFSLYVLRNHFLSADSTLITADSTLYTMDNNKPHPIAGRNLTYIGKEYRILSVIESPCRAFYKVILADKNSGR